MLSGLPPAGTGVRTNAYGRVPPPEARGFPLLAERILGAGWRTGAFVSASPLLAAFGLDQGFEVYDDRGLDDLSEFHYRERAGTETVDLALGWLRGLGSAERAFLWVHLFEPHAPYAPELSGDLPAEVRYDADVARADRVVGRLLDGLEALGRGNAVLLLTADHGEALGDWEKTHGILLGDAVLRVPFVLRAPRLPPGRRTDPVDLADVAPTLAALAGIPWPTPDGDRPGTGRDVLAGAGAEARIRVAETLYPHQRYGWAQLLAATGANGTLLDAGGDRVLWLEPAPFRESQAAPRPAAGRPDLEPLGRALAAYRAGERQDLLRAGGVAAGYGSAAPTAPFLPPEENGRLVDPYAAVPAALALDEYAQAIQGGAPLPDPVRALERMAAVDPANPEIRFWLGRALARRAETEPDPVAAKASRARAREAFLEACQRGRRDATTVGLAVGVDAEGEEAAALELLAQARRRPLPRLPADPPRGASPPRARPGGGRRGRLSPRTGPLPPSRGGRGPVAGARRGLVPLSVRIRARRRGPGPSRDSPMTAPGPVLPRRNSFSGRHV